MKRFTARFRTQPPAPDPDQMRKAIVEALLRTPMPVAFHIERVDIRGDEARVEIASDATREALQGSLVGVESRLPVRLESLGWGWPVSEASSPEADTGSSHRQDPFRNAIPQAEPEKVYLYSKANTVKMVLSCLTYASPLLVIGLILSNSPWAGFYEQNELTIQFLWVGYITFVAFMGVYRFPTRWPRWVKVNAQGMAVKHWLQPDVRKVDWKDIETLEMGNGQLVLRGRGRSMRFFTDGLAGKEALPMLVRTVAERAGLNFVESAVEKAVYRRFESQ
jgi:hypothetical protein